MLNVSQTHCRRAWQSDCEKWHNKQLTILERGYSKFSRWYEHQADWQGSTGSCVGLHYNAYISIFLIEWEEDDWRIHTNTNGAEKQADVENVHQMEVAEKENASQQ